MKFCILSNPDRVQWQAPVLSIIQYLLKNGQDAVLPHSHADVISDLPSSVKVLASDTDCVNYADIIIVVGGDGTMLRAAHKVNNSQKPIFGINSGKLGFLADTQLQEMEEALNQLINGLWEEDKRYLLKAISDNQEFYALNEFLFSKHADISMITLEVYCDELFVNKYWADGLIIATPTGSTAYNLSAGGPVIAPGTNVMVVTPVCPHALTTRSLVLSANRTIRVRSQQPGQEILFSNDGAVCDLKPGKLDVKISKADFQVKLVKLQDRNYFETLRSKLMWGQDLRE
jgi:NAD+ kinase